MSYIYYILVAFLYTLEVVYGEGHARWENTLIALGVLVFVFGIFLLCAFKLNTRHNGLFAALITIGAVLAVCIFFIILEGFTGPIDPPVRG